MDIFKSSETKFRSQVETFLNAVKNRDRTTFEKFFDHELEFTAILPGGRVFNDVPSFLESQADWFDGKTGTFNFLIERIQTSKNLGHALAKVKYQNVDQSGRPFTLDIHISFVFKKIKGKWFVIHDQNTVLKETRGAN